MAVTESKGNGYALYNGVKLPNIDTVWTEELKQTHPYAVMASVDYGEVTEEYAGVHMYSLNLLPIPPAYFGKDTNGSGTFTKCLFWDEVAEIPSYALVDSDKIGEQLGVQACVWFYTNRLVDDKIITGGFAGELFWTNYTILGADRVDGAITPDGTTHMEASDPIPLDGMNVIEWDGDTTGLEKVDTICRLADYQKAKNALTTGRNSAGFYVVADDFEFYEEDDVGPESWSIDLPNGTNVVAAMKSDIDHFSAGIWCDATGGEDVLIVIAYTPATTEPEEPAGEEINISFNDKNYSVNNVSLSAPTEALKSHMSTVMNGSGAVVHFDGAFYNIDSNKLSSATNDFVSHLGTVSGNGYKVVVNGIEHSVDSSKMANAVVEIGEACENLQNGGSGSGGSGGGSSLPEKGKTAEQYTWEEISAIGKAGKADEYFNLGDTKTINMGTYGNVIMEIVAFDADSKTNGETAAITWLSKDLIAKHAMNSTASNTGGWEASEMRSWLKSDIYTAPSSEVQSAIVTVKKTYYDYNGGIGQTLTCDDNVWIPSYREMFGEGFESSGATYSGYFTSDASRIKCYSGSDDWWWLRSAGSVDSVIFCNVNADGSSGLSYAYGPIGVALGFCTG